MSTPEERQEQYAEILKQFYQSQFRSQMHAQGGRPQYQQWGAEPNLRGMSRAQIFQPPQRQLSGPGWICIHCHFANDNPILTKCGDCRIAR